MMRFINFKILFKIKEEKVWWIKKRYDNYKPFLKLKLDKQMILIVNWMIFQEKAKKMMNKSDFWGNKLKKKEEKVPQMKIQLKKWNIF
jgi:hypothetical protein